MSSKNQRAQTEQPKSTKTVLYEASLVKQQQQPSNKQTEIKQLTIIYI
jgi:hypothetical protein